MSSNRLLYRQYTQTQTKSNKIRIKQCRMNGNYFASEILLVSCFHSLTQEMLEDVLRFCIEEREALPDQYSDELQRETWPRSAVRAYRVLPFRHRRKHWFGSDSERGSSRRKVWLVVDVVTDLALPFAALSLLYISKLLPMLQEAGCCVSLFFARAWGS